MSTYETTKTNGTGTACNYTPDCAYKLPCGLCRLMMSQCPKDSSQPIITWTNASGMNCAEGKL